MTAFFQIRGANLQPAPEAPPPSLQIGITFGTLIVENRGKSQYIPRSVSYLLVFSAIFYDQYFESYGNI